MELMYRMYSNAIDYNINFIDETMNNSKGCGLSNGTYSYPPLLSGFYHFLHPTHCRSGKSPNLIISTIPVSLGQATRVERLTNDSINAAMEFVTTEVDKRKRHAEKTRYGQYFPLEFNGYWGKRLIRNKANTVTAKQMNTSFGVKIATSKNRYFLFPNFKGTGNRLHLFFGLYYISAYFNISIILPESMKWHEVWTIVESFPSQILVLDDKDFSTLMTYSRGIGIRNPKEWPGSNANYLENVLLKKDMNDLFTVRFVTITGNNAITSRLLNSYIYTNDIIRKGYLLKSEKTLTVGQQSLFIMKRMMERILLPKPIVTDEVNRILREYNLKKFDAIQIRTGMKLEDIQETIVFMEKDDLPALYHCISDNCGNRHLFLTGDSAIVKKSIIVAFPHRNISYIERTTAIADAMKTDKNRWITTMVHSLAEMYVLGKSTTCILTKGSTFGNLGCIMNGHLPYIVGSGISSCLVINSTLNIDYSVCCK